MPAHSDRKAQLLDRMNDLKARLAHIEQDLVSHEAKDWDDLATEREEDEVLEGMGRTGQLELRQIEAALARLDAGEYGICVRCGAEIAEARLDLLPHTPFCQGCAV